MKMFLRLPMILMLVGFFGVKANNLEAKEKKSESIVERVGGDYLVKSITVLKEGVKFEILFESKVKSGNFDYLRLISDHVHFGIKEGSVVRLSADVVASKQKNGISDVDQMVLFLKGQFQERNPVWMSSASRNINSFGGAKYLEMHAPVSDYLIF